MVWTKQCGADYCGDIDEAQTLAWVNKYFGELKAGPKVENIAKQLTTLEKNRYYSLVIMYLYHYSILVFQTVYGMHEDEAALDVVF